MYLFNQKNIILVLKSLFCLTLISCVGKEKQILSDTEYASNAPFIVEQITKAENSVKSINFIEKDGLKNAFIVNLSTCLKDSFKKDNSIQETPFVIEYETNFDNDGKTGKRIERVEVTSDVNGCIRWEEEYKYRYVIKPKWIVLTRSIKKEEGGYSGQVEIPLAVNPWLKSSNEEFPEVLDLRKNYSEKYSIFKKLPYEKKGLEYLSRNESSEYPQLWAPEIGLQIETQLPKLSEEKRYQNPKELLKNYQSLCNSELKENCYKRHFKLNLTIPLQLRTYGLQKDVVDEIVKGGSYHVKLQLLAIPDINKKFYRIHENICAEDIHISNSADNSYRAKSINISCDIPISYFSQHANYKIAVEIDPKVGLPFTKFQGIYTINLSQEIKSGSLYTYNIDSSLENDYTKIPVKTPIIQNRNIKYIYDAINNNRKKISREGASFSEDKQLSRLGFHSVHLDVELKKMTFANVENDENCSNNESVVKRRVNFIGKACIKDVLTDYKNKGIAFRVFIEDEQNGHKIREVFSDTTKRTIPKADAEGCISWPDSIEHKNFDRQVYMPRKVHFLSEELNLYGTVGVAVTPWQRAFQAYQDISQLSRDEIRTDTKGVKKPKLIVNQFKSVNLFPSYVLDKFLNIHLFHSLYFLFQPFILRHDNIALGREGRAREVLRDGYYILRVLLLRNPQETGDFSRVVKPETVENVRKSILLREHNKDNQYIEEIAKGDIKGQYITHIDTVIKAKANFVNVYVPLHFTKEQFFYLASRNLISIQVIPVDPEGFKFKELNEQREICEIDFDKTEWKPFFDHDLIVKPSVGVFQIQNWTNWNILQPMNEEKFNTDMIIDADEEGKKYRHFTLSQDSSSVDIKPAEIEPSVLQQGYNDCVGEESDGEKFNIESCHPSKVTDKSEITIEGYYQEKVEKIILEKAKTVKKDISSEDLIDSFAEINALKVVNLGEESGNKFLKNLKYSHNETYLLDENGTINYKILDFISNKKIKKEMEQKIEKDCEMSSLTSFLLKYMITEALKTCMSESIEGYLVDWINQQSEDKDVQHEKFRDFLDEQVSDSEITHTFKWIMQKQELPNALSSLLLDRVSLSLETVIDKGVTDKYQKEIETLTFGKSLCGFWFKSFFEKYLTSQQMRTVYTDYIKKFDYYKVLENESLLDTEKGDFLISFMKMLSDGETMGERDLKKCHLNYSQCVFLDHCKLRDHTRHSKSYCNKVSGLEDLSCLKVVKEECKKNPSTSICQKNIEPNRCHYSLNHFCGINSSHSMCQRYYSRCLTEYYSCTDIPTIRKDFEKSKNEIELFRMQPSQSLLDAYFDFKFYKSKNVKSPLLESCLENPFRFFQLESKMFIEKISDDSATYVGGFSGNLVVSGSFSTGSYMNWTSQRGSSLGLKHGTSLGFGLLGSNITAMEVSLSKNVSSNISNSGRRAIDIRVGEGAFLVISRATFDINVTKFKKCLVIKPNPQAFFGKLVDGIWEPFDDDVWNDDFTRNSYKKILISRPGLMICSPKKELDESDPETIRENYYYISQSMVDPSNSQFLNLYDLANRPFMAVLRGRREFLNFFNGMKIVMEGKSGDVDKNALHNTLPSNMFGEYPHPVEEALSLSLARREFGKTGFYPGVFTYAYSRDNFNRELTKDSAWMSKLFKSYESINYGLPLVTPSENKIPTISY